MELTTRKSLYFMPFLLIDETIECKEVWRGNINSYSELKDSEIK